MKATQSIHHRRRWFYVLWVLLLLASISALVLWETPKRSGKAKLTLRLKVMDLPPQTLLKVWVGPRKCWPGAAWKGQGAAVEVCLSDEKINLDAVLLPVAYRRWVEDTIPSRTADLVVLRFEAPGQIPRYVPLALGKDWRSGLLRPNRVISLGFECGWERLKTDPSRFSVLE